MNKTGVPAEDLDNLICPLASLSSIHSTTTAHSVVDIEYVSLQGGNFPGSMLILRSIPGQWGGRVGEPEGVEKMSSKSEYLEGTYLLKLVEFVGLGLGGIGGSIRGFGGGWVAARTEVDRFSLILITLNGEVLAYFLEWPKLQKTRLGFLVWIGPVGESREMELLMSWCRDWDEQVVEALTLVAKSGMWPNIFGKHRDYPRECIWISVKTRA